MAETRRKTFNYKIAKFKNDGKLTLRNCLEASLTELPKAMMRQQATMIDGEKGFRLINQIKDMGKLYCGVLMSYKEGQHQNRIRIDLDADELSVDMVAPSTENAEERHEFVEGLLYFGVYRNHVIFVGSAHLHSFRFEKYLNWLLSNKTRVIPRAEEVMITDAVKPEYKDRQFSKLRELKVKTYIATEEEQRESQTESVVLSEQTTRPVGREWDATRGFLEGLGVPVPNVNFQGSLGEEDLELTFTLKMKGRRRGLANLNTPVIDGVANALRHIENAPIELEFEDGTRFKGEDFKVSKSFSVQSRNGIPINENVYQRMVEWFDILLANKDINPQ